MRSKKRTGIGLRIIREAKKQDRSKKTELMRRRDIIRLAIAPSPLFQSLKWAMIAVCGGTMLALPVSAQLNGLSNPAIIDRALNEPETINARGPAPIILPEATAAPDGSDDVFFTVQTITIRGNQLFSLAEITDLSLPPSGTEIAVADIYALSEAITQHYRTEGYALSFAFVPAQEIASGNVLIEVIEGQITELRIRETNLSDLARRHILDAFERFAQKGTTRTDDLEEFLLLVNDYPGITAQGIITAGNTKNSSAMVLEVQQRIQSASIGYQNYLSESLGRDVFLADLALLGQWTGRDEARLSLRQAPDPLTYRSVRFDYSTYVDDTDLEIFIRTTESATKPEKGPLHDLSFTSSAYSQTVGMRYPIWKRRSDTLTVGGHLSVSDSSSLNGDTISTNDKTRAVTAYADYEIDLASGASHFLHIELEQGAKFFHARANSRANANLHHSVLRLSDRYRQPLFIDSNKQIDATLRLFAQVTLSDDPLYSNAECGFGGRGFGVGMDAGTLSGEDCLLASLQINYQRPFTHFEFLPPSILTLLGRIDAGSVRQKGLLTPGQERQQEAITAAIGAQFAMEGGLTIQLERATQVKNEEEPKKEGEDMTNISVNLSF